MTFPNDYSLFDTITIDHTRIASGGVTGMDIWLPVSLLSETAKNTLKSDGADARFTLNDGSTRLAHDVMIADNQLAGFRVYLPNLSDSSDTQFRCWYNGIDTLEAAGSPYGQHATYPSHVTAYWPMNNDPDNDAADAILDHTSNNFHATTTGGMTTTSQVDGKVGKCLHLDGSNDMVLISNNIITSSIVAIEMWAKMDSLVNCKLFEHNSAAGYFKLGITLGSIDFNVVSSTGDRTISSSPSDNSQWTHILAVASEDQHMTLWVNASQVDSLSCGSFSAISTFGSAIGADRRGTYSHVDGQIDEVRISHADLGQAYATTRYNNESDPATFFSDITASDESTAPPSGTSRKFAVIGSSLIRSAHC
ncbi:MAG: LamG domain-containing protein [Phycisphaeraceae bacterium JB051]